MTAGTKILREWQSTLDPAEILPDIRYRTLVAMIDAALLTERGACADVVHNCVALISAILYQESQGTLNLDPAIQKLVEGIVTAIMNR